MFFMPCCSFDHLGKIIMKYLLNKKFHETCTVSFCSSLQSPSSLKASISFLHGHIFHHSFVSDALLGVKSALLKLWLLSSWAAELALLFSE